MKRFVFLVASASLLVISCGKENNDPLERIKSGDPVVTAEAADVTASSVILYGYVNTEYLISNGECGFIVSTAATPSMENGQKVVSAEVDKNGKYFVQVFGLTSSTTYYYKAFLNIGTTNLVGDIKTFTTEEFVYVAIDMGLSVKWANANLGASSPEGYGDYYAWGETETKEEYNWGTYKWIINDKLTKYNTSASNGTIDNKTILYAEDDVAHVKLGGKWRMPTRDEVAELVATRNNSSYQWVWKSLNGHKGWLVTYLVNNNSIFLPAADQRFNSFFYGGGNGFYWSSSLFTDASDCAWCFQFADKNVHMESYFRFYGFSVRPVSE